MSLVIDVHTHMLNAAWLELLKRHGAPRYSVAPVDAGVEAVHKDGAPFMTLSPGMFVYELRIRMMDRARVDLAVVPVIGRVDDTLVAGEVVMGAKDPV